MKRVLQRHDDVKRHAAKSKWLTWLTSFVEMRAYHWTMPNLDLSTGIKINVRHMCSARSGNGPTRVNTIDKQLKNESVKKEDTEFCGENLIVRKLNVCFIK